MEEKNKHLLIEVSGNNLHVELENMSIGNVAAVPIALAAENVAIAAALLHAAARLVTMSKEQCEALKQLEY